jgi:hypothetical protein
MLSPLLEMIHQHPEHRESDVVLSALDKTADNFFQLFFQFYSSKRESNSYGNKKYAEAAQYAIVNRTWRLFENHKDQFFDWKGLIDDVKRLESIILFESTHNMILAITPSDLSWEVERRTTNEESGFPFPALLRDIGSYWALDKFYKRMG